MNICSILPKIWKFHSASFRYINYLMMPPLPGLLLFVIFVRAMTFKVIPNCSVARITLATLATLMNLSPLSSHSRPVIVFEDTCIEFDRIMFPHC